MAEVVIPEGKWADQIPRFTLPAEFQPPAPEPVVEAKPAEAVPDEPKPAEEATATEVETTEETTGKDPEKATTRRFERRMDRAVRARAEAQAKADAFERELTELKAKAVPPKADDSAPRMEDFTDVQEYAKAFAAHETKKAIAERETSDKQARNKQAQQQLHAKWESQVTKATEKYDDFEEVVGDLKPTTPWAIALMQEDNGADIAHYLGKHEKEAERIIALDPYSQAREIGKLSVKLASPAAPKVPSRTPAPIEPVKATAVQTDGIEPNQSPEHYFKIGNKMFRRGR